MPRRIEVFVISEGDSEDHKLLKHILIELRAIRRELEPPTLTQHIQVQFSGDSMANSLTLNVGQTSQASIVPLLGDGTPSGGAVSNVVYTFSDPSATVSSSGLVTGVAASSRPVSGSASCTVTDTDGVVSQWTQAFTIQTNAVAPPPQQLTQSVSVEFSIPQ